MRNTRLQLHYFALIILALATPRIVQSMPCKKAFSKKARLELEKESRKVAQRIEWALEKSEHLVIRVKSGSSGHLLSRKVQKTVEDSSKIRLLTAETPQALLEIGSRLVRRQFAPDEVLMILSQHSDKFDELWCDAWMRLYTNLLIGIVAVNNSGEQHQKMVVFLMPDWITGDMLRSNAMDLWHRRG